MTKRHLTIATRESSLAIKQAEIIQQAIMQFNPNLFIELLGLTTRADKMLDITLTEIGGKGLFVKELEEALLDGRADIAVHSMKDVPMELPAELYIPIMTNREDPRDAFVSNQYESIHQLPRNAVVGTSSLRRQKQLLSLRSDLEFRNLRGNINTRLQRLDSGDYDAIILAGAGLKRINLASRIRSYLSLEQCLPAAGQGALGIECRKEDHALLTLLAPINDVMTQVCVNAERALCRRLGGNCKVPIAAHAEVHRGILLLRGLVASRDGIKILRAKLEGDPHHAEQIGLRVAEELLQQGAEKILREFT